MLAIQVAFAKFISQFLNVPPPSTFRVVPSTLSHRLTLNGYDRSIQCHVLSPSCLSGEIECIQTVGEPDIKLNSEIEYRKGPGRTPIGPILGVPLVHAEKSLSLIPGIHWVGFFTCKVMVSCQVSLVHLLFCCTKSIPFVARGFSLSPCHVCLIFLRFFFLFWALSGCCVWWLFVGLDVLPWDPPWA